MNCARQSFLVAWVLLLACGPSAGEEDGGGTSTAASTGETTATSSGGASADETVDGTVDATTEETGAMPTSGSLGNGHGVVALELQRGGDEAVDPFVGTARVEVSLLYRECLIAFYEANPSWRQDGADGSAVFESVLAEGLCDPADPVIAGCTVAEVAQELDVTASLTVRYDITGALEGRQLHLGPLPSMELAACPDGGFPIVRVASSGSVRGFDANGTQIWGTEAFSPAEGATDQGAVITIRAAPV